MISHRFHSTLRYAALFSLAFLVSLRAQEISVQPGGKDGIYEVGATATWAIEAKGEVAAIKELKYELKTGGLTVSKAGPLELKEGKASFSASFDQPGWLFLEVSFKDAAGKEQKSWGGALFSPEKIKPSSPTPADFDSFWQDKLKELATVPAKPELTKEESGKEGVDMWTIKMDNIRNSHIHGVLARPQQGEKFPALLIVQWAGVYSLDKSWAANRAAQGWLTLNVQAHDLPAIGPKYFYDDLFAGILRNYWAIGNDDKDTSYFLRMYLSCYRAAEYLTTRPDWDGRILVVTGGSQGGLQTLLTAAIHPKVTAAVAIVPAGCDLTGPDAGRYGGWPRWYEHAQGKNLARVNLASRYYDLVNFVPRIKCPTFVAVGLIDNVCPPDGIIAATNRMKAPKEVMVMPYGGHQARHEVCDARVEEWFKILKDGKLPEIK